MYSNILYEGDLVFFTVDGTVPANGYINLYRALSPLDTGEAISAKFDTEWHLIGRIPANTINTSEIAFTDGGPLTTDPLDLNLSQTFYPPITGVDHFDISESGWFITARVDGTVAASERFLPHAWPIDYRFSLGVQIRDIAVHYDNIYVGTNAAPFIIPLKQGEQAGLEANPFPFPEPYPCLAGSMAATATGAIYAAPQGLVGLSPEGQRVLTRGIANSGDTLYSELTLDLAGNSYRLDYQFEDVQFGFTYKGQYFGVMQSGYILEDGDTVPFQKTALVFDLKDPINGAHEFQQLVTLDIPASTVLDTCTGPQGLYLLTTAGIYVLPLPDNQTNITYDRADKYCYIWRSKIYVFPGDTTMAAARISMKGPPIRFRLVSGCECLYETVVCNNRPFTIPNQILAKEFCIELEGTAEVTEVVVASSMRELLEND